MAASYDIYRNYDSTDTETVSHSGPLPQITDVDETSLNPVDWSRDNYNFLGWNTSSDGSGDMYQPGDTPAAWSAFAIWKEAVVVPDVTISYNGNTIVSLSDSGIEVLETNGKLCEDDITIDYTKPTPNLQSKSVSPTTSNQTITADSGYDGLSQVTVHAIYPTKSSETFTPTTTDQTIQSGRWLTGAQTIKGDANLVAGNIKKDVQIFNVTGSYEGSGSNSVEEKDVNFIDYDGTLLYSYTASEFAALTALPANPSHTGLTAQGWNWTLSDAKTYVASYKKLVIGQMYTTSDGKTRIYIELPDRRLTMPLRFSQTVSNGVTIDWGDGTTSETISGTGAVTTSHTYASNGKYVIALNATSGKFAIDNYIYGSDSALNVYKNAIKKVEIGNNFTGFGNYAFIRCYSLAAITIPNSFTNLTIGSYMFDSCYNLSSITIPSGITQIKQCALYSCYTIKNISIPKSVTSIASTAFGNDYSLNCISISDNITAISISMVGGSRSLSSIIVPENISTIDSNAFKDCLSLAMIRFAPTTPPTVSNSNAFTNVPTDCLLLIPCNRKEHYSDPWYAERYLAATNYPSKSTYNYIGYWTLPNGYELPWEMDNYYAIWYPTIEDLLARTNRILVGNGNEIYCRFESMWI